MLWHERAACLLCCFGAASSAEALDIQQVQTRFHGGEYQLELTATLAAPVDRVETVIRDYPHYRELDARILEARVLERSTPDRLLLLTRLNVCFGVFCRKVERVEAVQEQPHELHALSLPERSDVKRGETHTVLSAAGDRTQLHYTTSIAPKFWVPVFGRNWMLNTLREASIGMFENVEKRAQASATPSSDATANPNATIGGSIP